jgi:hypothetical protein
MNWIKVATGIMSDPSILGLAEALGVSAPLTTGCVVGVLTHLPDHARNGDVSGVSDRALEQWAQWPGKKGKFAGAFRTYLCDPQGVVRAWDKHNGSAMREAEQQRIRMREARKARREEAQRAPNVSLTLSERALLRNGTERNVVTTTAKEGAAQIALITDDAPAGAARSRAAAKPKVTAKWPQWPEDERRRMHARWESRLGPTDYKAWVANVGGELAPLRATVADGTVERAWGSVVDYVAMGGRETPFLSDKPARVAKRTILAVKAFQETDDPERLARKLELIVHGREVT